MDALTHAIEGYITKGAHVISDMFEIKAIEMIGKHLRGAVADKNLTDMAEIALKDGCTPTNPREPKVEELKELFKKVYNGM